MSNVIDINDHIALICECSSANWALLRNHKIQCNQCCNILPDGFWDCKNEKYPDAKQELNLDN